MLISPAELLAEARRGGWAIGGSNVYNLESARAVVRAAERARAPVMVQTSHGAVAHAGMAELVVIVGELARTATVPVALHLDHGKDPALARAAIEAGYSSVMIDTSALPLAENIRATREIVEAARPRGVQVEAELGTLAGIEDLGDSEHGETLTRPSDAERFARETGADSLAVAVGTAHGAAKFRGEPRGAAGSRGSTSRDWRRSRSWCRSRWCSTAPRRSTPRRWRAPRRWARDCRARAACRPS